MRPLDDFDGPDRVLIDLDDTPSADEWPGWAPLAILAAAVTFFLCAYLISGGW